MRYEGRDGGGSGEKETYYEDSKERGSNNGLIGIYLFVFLFDEFSDILSEFRHTINQSIY